MKFRLVNQVKRSDLYDLTDFSLRSPQPVTHAHGHLCTSVYFLQSGGYITVLVLILCVHVCAVMHCRASVGDRVSWRASCRKKRSVKKQTLLLRHANKIC